MIKNLLIVLIVLLLLLTLISTFGGSIRFQETYADLSEDDPTRTADPMMAPPPASTADPMMPPPPPMQEPYAHAPAHTIPTSEQEYMEETEPIGAGSSLVEPFDGGAYASC